MKKEFYDNLKKQIPGFEINNCNLVDPLTVFVNPKHSQVRKNGHVLQNVPRMKELLIDNWLNGNPRELPPVSVKPSTHPNHKDEVIDGATRTLAAREIVEDPNLKNLNFKLFVSDHFYQTKKPNSIEEIIVFQASQNDHNVSMSNSREDIEKQLVALEKGKYFQTLAGVTYNQDKKRYIEAIEDFCRKTYPNSGIRFSTTINKVLKGLTTSHYQSFNNKTACEFVKNNSTLSWNGDGSGEIASNECIYTFGSVSKFSKFGVGGAWKKRVNNQKVKIYGVAYIDNTVGMDDQALMKARKLIEKEYDLVNNQLTVSGVKIFDGLYFCPQILSGPLTESNNLIKSR